MSELKPSTFWPDDKNVTDFLIISANLRESGQTARAQAIEYLVARVQKAEPRSLDPPRDEYEFIVDVMDSLRDYPDVLTDAVNDERKVIVKRYDELKVEKSFRSASRIARAEWLRSRIAGGGR